MILSGEIQGTLNINGSAVMNPVMAKEAAAFNAAYPKANIVSGTSSTQIISEEGLSQLCGVKFLFMWLPNFDLTLGYLMRVNHQVTFLPGFVYAMENRIFPLAVELLTSAELALVIHP
jgi:hypothetical protein